MTLPLFSVSMVKVISTILIVCPATDWKLGLQKEEPASASELVDGKIVYKDPAEAELEKKKARAARFGVPLSLTEDKKRDIRAQRYHSLRF